jgi:hypothetical protein
MGRLALGAIFIALRRRVVGSDADDRNSAAIHFSCP